EGAGAGCIQLGDGGNVIKTNPAYLEHMDWEGGVIDAPYTSADMPALLEDLESNASWLEEVRQRNVSNCLLRHDHLNRWDMVLKAAGLDATPTAAARRIRLKEQAATLTTAPTRILSRSQNR
ncbi:hypothetical protein N9L47_13490, partial [Rhodobacteraceae bacterium]|nr:hypothetical protein [Paracoccaceae bacterium]